MPKRAFSPEFLAHARANTGWPVEKSVQIWCDTTNRTFMQNGVYSRLARGELSDERHVGVVVYFLLDAAHATYPERTSLNEFLRLGGMADPSKATPQEVLSKISLVREDIPDDGWGMGRQALLLLFNTILKPAEHCRLIPRENEREVRDAVGWMCVEAGRQLASLDLAPVEALSEAKRRMGISMDAYQERALAWWRREPWTVVHAVGDRGRGIKGMCIVLPVTKSFYERARSGACASFDCNPEDIEAPSRFLIIEGVAPETEVRRKSGGPGWSLFAALHCHAARVSDVPGLGEGHGKSLHLLTFAGTPVGKRRAKRMGFKAVGTCFPGTAIEYMELQVSIDGRGFRDATYMGIWRGLQLHVRESYRER